MQEGQFVTVGTLRWITGDARRVIADAARKYSPELGSFCHRELLLDDVQDERDECDRLFILGWHVSHDGRELTRSYLSYRDSLYSLQLGEDERPLVSALPEPFSIILDAPLYCVDGESAERVIGHSDRFDEWQRDWQWRFDNVSRPTSIWATLSELERVGTLLSEDGRIDGQVYWAFF